MRVWATSLQSFPKGDGENGPGWSPHWRTESWEGVPHLSTPSRRDGRISPPHIARIVLNPVLLEKGNELGLEIALAMMLFLARDVLASVTLT